MRGGGDGEGLWNRGLEQSVTTVVGGHAAAQDRAGGTGRQHGIKAWREVASTRVATAQDRGVGDQNRGWGTGDGSHAIAQGKVEKQAKGTWHRRLEEGCFSKGRWSCRFTGWDSHALGGSMGAWCVVRLRQNFPRCMACPGGTCGWPRLHPHPCPL